MNVNPEITNTTKDEPEQAMSDCCGMPMSGEMIDVGICPECKEHCDVDYGEES
jgi:hypothetical protein